MADNLLAGRRILVVEDEMLVLMLIEDMLTDLGCTSVATAATVEEAFALIEAQHFDAAMLDVNLNGVKSYPVAEKLAARGVPFFFSTGYSDHGIDGHHDRPVLTKPYGPRQIEATFSQLLSHPTTNLTVPRSTPAGRSDAPTD